MRSCHLQNRHLPQLCRCHPVVCRVLQRLRLPSTAGRRPVICPRLIPGNTALLKRFSGQGSVSMH